MNKEDIIDILENRFKKHAYRHENVSFEDVKSKVLNNQTYIKTLIKMEETGGEPDVVNLDHEKDQIVFIDCSKESPKQRRSVCYDHEALEARKKFPPKDSALHMAKEIGIELLDEKDYKSLQQYGPFDEATSSWVLTPKKIRDLGGALFCDYRYQTVFTYHNGADSYYGSRGFRGKLVIK